MGKDKLSDVFFDLDHTLWDFDKNSSLALQSIFAERNESFSFDEFLKVYVPINADYWRKFSLDLIDQHQLRLGRIKDSYRALGVDILEEEIHVISDLYIQRLPLQNHLIEGAEEMLEYLYKKYDLHILTNGFDEVQSRKINNSGIRKYFKTVTNSENSGVKKPDPFIFNFALNQANTTAAKSLMIGDDWDADIIGAINSGWSAVYYNANKSKCNYSDNVHEIHQLLELKNII